MESDFMLGVLVVSLILALTTLIRLKLKRFLKVILKSNFACFVTPSKVIKRFEVAQEVCEKK